MAAGESAYDLARRQREKAERLQRSAALWERGAQGEEAVASALAALPESWIALHDLAWPGRPRANIDHVVIGPGGVFVVDAKNWSGRVEVRDEVLTQNGRSRESAVASAAEAALAVQAIASSPATCTGVLCFVRDEPLAAWARDVMVCSTGNLTDLLVAHPHVLSPDDVRRCAEAVRAGAVRRTEAPAAKRVKSRSSKRSRPILALVGALALLAAIWSGGYQKAAEWVGDQLVGVIAPDTPTQPTPNSPAKKKQKRERDRPSPS